MAISPFVKAGVALSSAAMIAAIPAIAPPLTPKDERVVAGAQATLAASTEDLINIFFNVDPGDWPGFDSDNPSNGGITGVIYRLLWDATDDDAATQALVSEFFNNGVDGVTEQLLLAFAPAESADYIQAFFGDGPLSNDDPGTTGIQGVIYQALYDAADGNTAAQGLITTFFESGYVGLSQLALIALAPGLEPLINNFYDGGVDGVIGNALVDAAPEDLDPYIERYFKIGDYSDSDTYGPGETGASGVVLQFLNQVGPAETDELFDSYFAGGATSLAQTIINNNIDPNSVPGQLINEFINTGVDGVVRYLLAGPAPEESPAPTLAKFGTTTVEEDTDDVEAPVTPKLEGSAPSIESLGAPVDITPPALPKLPKKFSINKDKALGTEALADTTVEGSEDEILLEGTGAPKPLNFENWKKVGKIADSVGSFLKPKKTEAEPAADKTETKDKGDE